MARRGQTATSRQRIPVNPAIVNSVTGKSSSAIRAIVSVPFFTTEVRRRGGERRYAT